MIEDIAITEVVPHRDGEYGLFLLESRAWEIKLEPGQAETIREGLATATGGSTTSRSTPRTRAGSRRVRRHGNRRSGRSGRFVDLPRTVYSRPRAEPTGRDAAPASGTSSALARMWLRVLLPRVLAREAAVDAGARRSKLTALVLLGLGVAFYLAFALGEMAGGDITGLQHLLPAAVLALLFCAAWRRPRQAGIVLLVLAVPFDAAYIALLVVRDLPLAWALVVALPPVVTGLLLVHAGRRMPGAC